VIDFHAGPVDAIIAAEFLALFVCCVWVGIGTVRHSQDAADDFWRLPPTDRVLLSAVVFSVALVFLDIVRLRLAPGWLEPLWTSDPDHWSVIVIRALPLPALGWFALRVNGATPAGAVTPVTPVRDMTIRRVSDNARRTLRFGMGVVAAGFINELFERGDVYYLVGFAEMFGVAAWMMAIAFLWETMEDRLGVRVFGPLDRAIGEVALGKRPARPVPGIDDGPYATVHPRRRSDDWQGRS